MRIGLLTTLQTNIGDDFIREGLMSVVQSLRDKPLEFVLVNKHEPHTVYPAWHPIRLSYKTGFRARRKFGPIRRPAERFLPPFGFTRFDACDLILQCGTPVIWNDCRSSEWARLVWRDVLGRLGRLGRPILNLGGGSCYPWEARPGTLVGDPDEDFIRVMLGAAKVTTVRDRLARSLFASLGYNAPQLCCPAILAGQVFTTIAKPTRKVVVNYMQGGGHYDMGQDIDGDAWERAMREVVRELQRDKWEPLMLAHNEAEFALALRIWPELPRILPKNSKEYFEAVRDAAFGVLNRLHASVAIAGLGVPSVAVGTDTRNLMVETLGLPVFFVKDAGPERLLGAVNIFMKDREKESRRLLELREETFREYQAILKPFL